MYIIQSSSNHSPLSFLQNLFVSSLNQDHLSCASDTTEMMEYEVGSTAGEYDSG